MYAHGWSKHSHVRVCMCAKMLLLLLLMMIIIMSLHAHVHMRTHTHMGTDAWDHTQDWAHCCADQVTAGVGCPCMRGSPVWPG